MEVAKERVEKRKVYSNHEYSFLFYQEFENSNVNFCKYSTVNEHASCIVLKVEERQDEGRTI